MPTQRKLAAILCADVVGYSRLMAEDEAGTIQTLKSHRDLMGGLIRQHTGRVVDAVGDNLLADFPSIVDAVACAVAIQKEIEGRNEELPEERRMLFRIGVNLGDVIVEEDHIYGDGVNIAARVEALAEPGGVSISGTTFDHVEGKLGLGFEDLGEHEIKNMPRPVRVYRVQRVQMHLPRPETRALALPDKPSIAVLPFVNMSRDPDQEYFADGITEDLITDLSRISGLFVIARTSVFTFKNQPVKVGDVGRELGVRYVLEGSVRKAGERVRITAQLVEASMGHHLWAERYDRSLADIFAVQDDVTAKIVAALEVTLTERERTHGQRVPTDNLEAYDYFLRGLSYFGRGTSEGNGRAREMFERAIALDPEFAIAHSSIARTHLADWSIGATGDRSTLDQALESAREAISLDHSLAVPHGVLGVVHALAGQYDDAVAEAESAVSLDPSSAQACNLLGEVLNLSGKPEEAVRALRKAERLDPQRPSRYCFNLGVSYRLIGQYEEAIANFNRALNDRPDFLPARGTLAAIYAHLGQRDKAQGEAAEILRIHPGFSLRNVPRFSFKDPAEDDWLIDGLRKAGLKE